MSVRFTSLTALVPTGGPLAEALGYYCGSLGFAVEWRDDASGMAGIARGDVRLNLVENENRQWIDNASFRISVEDLDAFYAEISGVAGHLKPPFITPWGLREIHLIAPSGVCFQFYQTD